MAFWEKGKAPNLNGCFLSARIGSEGNFKLGHKEICRYLMGKESFSDWAVKRIFFLIHEKTFSVQIC